MTGMKDFLEYRSLSGLSANSTGERLGFDVMQPDLTANRYRGELWQYVHSEARRMVGDGDYAGHFIWREENKGEYAAVIGNGRTKMARMDMDSGKVEDGWVIPAEISALCHLGDNLYAYTAQEEVERESHPPELAFLDEQPGAWEIIDEIPLWGDGQGFTSRRRNRLFLFDRAGGQSTALLDANSSVDEMQAQGGKLYLKARSYRGVNVEAGLYRYDPASGEMTELAPQGVYRIFEFAPCKDGVVFAAQDTREQCMTDDPYFYIADGDGLRRLSIPSMSVGNSVSSDCIYGESRTFHCGGDTLYFLHTGEHSSFLMAADLSSGQVEKRSDEGGSIEDMAVTNQGVFAVAMRGQALQELYRIESDGGLKTLTAINQCAAKEAIPPQRFTFQNHGFNVNYVVLPPADYDPAQKYPAILYIHGGAKVLYTDVFFHEMQFLASSGYFVIYGNPRGSEGQGSEFARLLGEYGQKDFDDLMKAVDTALERYPAIDPQRLGVAGGSYGGIMTNWCITHSQRFRAAVSQRSICNMVSTFGTADNGYGFVREQMDGDLWQGFDKLWNQSPLKYTDNCRTPLLLIHSTEDYRCHYTEAVQMFTAMKYLGVACRLCLIDGESHGLSRKGRPVQRIKRLYEIWRWFGLHLKD